MKRALQVATIAVAVAALAATLYWVLGTSALRPLDGVEGDILFEASRIRAGLPLYVDPAVGAMYPGSLVPARYLVLYPPLWSALLAIVPASKAAIVGRVVGTVAWLGTLAVVAGTAPEKSRRVVVVAAAMAGGTWLLTVYGASARPDALACALVGIALLRSVRRGEVDALAGALFVVAAFVKPNVLGAAPGAIAATVLLGQRSLARRLAPLVGAAVAAIVIAGTLTIASGGRVWIDHLLASTGQPPSLALWRVQLASRLPFFGAPIAVALLLGVRAWRAGETRAPVATLSLATSLVWCLLALAKTGSAANYWLEPCLAALVLVGHVPWSLALGRAQAALASGLVLLQASWIGVASVRSALEGVDLARERAALVASARELCGAAPGQLVAADEPGLELMLDGRILQTPFQSTHLARRGRFDLEAWANDLRSPEIAGMLLQDDLLERPLDRVDVEHDRFPPPIRRLLRDRLVRVRVAAGFHLYRAR